MLGEKFLKSAEVEEILRLGHGTLTVWRSMNRHPQPPFVKLGRLVRYRSSDVEKFVRELTTRPAA